MTHPSSTPLPGAARPRVRARVLATALLLAGCGSGSGPADPGPAAPVITVTGVEQGGVHAAPVVVEIEVDRGSYTATLDGAAFLSGTSVSEPGPHRLEVEARNGAALSSLAVDFRIEGAGDAFLIVRVLDLGANDSGGGGDAILVTDSSAAGQRHVLIDAGPAGIGGSDSGFVARRLETLGVDSLQALLLSHAHEDHFGGMGPVLDAVRVERFVYNGQVRSFSRYGALVSRASAAAAQVVVPATPWELTFGLGEETTRLRVLPPLGDSLSAPDAGSSAINEESLGAALSHGSFRMFLAGDGEVRANLRWRTEFAAESRAVEVLKVGHHGANDAVFDNGFSGGSTWLEHTEPEYALISANGTSHPRLNALNRLLQRSDTRTLCTPVHGAITVRVAPDGAYAVAVERNSEMDCEPGSEATT